MPVCPYAKMVPASRVEAHLLSSPCADLGMCMLLYVLVVHQRTVVAIHAGIDDRPCCDVKDCVLPAVPVIHLIKGEGLGGLLV